LGSRSLYLKCHRRRNGKWTFKIVSGTRFAYVFLCSGAPQK
jgi:hypothetical protein